MLNSWIGSGYLVSRRFLLILKTLPRKFRSLSMRLQLIVLVGVVIVLLGSRAATAEVPSNVFASYTSILPGQPITALEAFDCKKVESRSNGQLVAGTSLCILFPEGEKFDIVNVRSEGDKISEVTFYATDLKLAELLLSFGYPTEQTQGTKRLKISWARPDYSVEVFTENYRFYNRVRIVLFTSRPNLHPTPDAKR